MNTTGYALVASLRAATSGTRLAGLQQQPVPANLLHDRPMLSTLVLQLQGRLERDLTEDGCTAARLFGPVLVDRASAVELWSALGVPANLRPEPDWPDNLVVVAVAAEVPA